MNYLDEVKSALGQNTGSDDDKILDLMSKFQPPASLFEF
jgi:hypothetical protein